MKVELVRCADLRDADAVGKSDPYAVVEFAENDGMPRRRRTHTLENNLNPEWNVTKYFLLADECKSFRVDVFDEDVGRDDRLGHCTILRAEAHLRERRNGGWFALEDGRHGRIELFFSEIHLTNLNTLRSQRHSQIAAAPRGEFDLLEITVFEGENCRGGGMFGKPDPYAKIMFEDLKEDNMVFPHEVLHTHTCKDTRDPVWDYTFYYLIHRDVRAFTIRVMDEDIGRDDSLGHCHILIGELNEAKEQRMALEKGKGTIRVSHCRTTIDGFFD
jgi:Ca2+-dependent lipid-binding protein